MAQRKLKRAGEAGQAASPRLRPANSSMAPVASPARALHEALSDQLATPLEGVLPFGQRVAIISLLASISWVVVGGSAYLLIR
jgi:hypothetical protein